MTKTTRRSGTSLILLALVGVLYFWATDPRYGPDTRRDPAYVWKPAWRLFRTEVSVDPRHWLYVMRGSPENPVDAAHTAQLSTFVGIAGCAVVLGIGCWLLTRRTV
jgi:hypothetical protein